MHTPHLVPFFKLRKYIIVLNDKVSGYSTTVDYWANSLDDAISNAEYIYKKLTVNVPATKKLALKNLLLQQAI